MLHGQGVVDVACGGWHSLFACSDGKAYACGSNTYGQLGVGHLSNELLPRPCVSMDSETSFGHVA
ncbi:MAG: hypothetical protein ACK56I_31855, partial [bacterium]